MESSSSRTRDHKWKIPAQIGPVLRQQVTGNDTLDARGSTGSHLLSGGSGSDTLYGNGNSVLSGGSGADEFHITSGDRILEAESHDRLFYNGVEILDDGNDILWGWEIGPDNGRAYIPIWQNGEGLSEFVIRPAVDADIAIVFEITGLDDDFDGTASGVIHRLHIFEDVHFDESSTLGVPPLDQQFRLFDAVATIDDWRMGDFGLFPVGLENTTHYGPMANSLDLQERLTLDGTYHPLGGISNGPSRLLSGEALEDEATFEELTETLSDDWLTAQDEAAVADASDQADFFTGDGPSTSGGGGNDTYILNASANVASGGDDSDLIAGMDGNDTLNGDSGNDRIFGNAAPGTQLFEEFVGFGDEPTDPGGPIIPFDPPTNEYEQGYNDGYAVGYAEGGEFTNPPPDLPFTDYDLGFYDGYYAGFDAFFDGNDSGSEPPEPETPISDDDHLFGGLGDDTIYGDRGDDLIEGDEDNDNLYGESGDDTVLGGDGLDNIQGGDGADSLSGDGDADEVHGGAGNDTVSGDAGDDAVYGNAGDDSVSGGEGADTVSGGDGNDVIRGDGGDDLIIAAAGNDSVYGGTGDDTISGGFGDHTYYYSRGDGSDTIRDGGPFAYVNTDRIVFTDIDSTEAQFRREGDDFVVLLADGERIVSEHQFQLGNDGIEFLDFADGVSVEITEDIVETTEDDGIVNGTDSDDVIDNSYVDADGASVGEGDDTIAGGLGNDTIIAQGGDDTIIYGAGNDVIENGNTGSDTLDLSAYAAADVSFRVSGHDVLIMTPDGEIQLDYQVRYEIGNANSNIETILFSDGSLDEAGIKARALGDQSTFGDDVITGTIQADLIFAGAGDDTMTGGNGADVFVFNLGDGSDVINDFDPTVDLIRFEGTALGFGDLQFTQIGADTEVAYDAPNTILLDGVDVVSLTADQFEFA